MRIARMTMLVLLGLNALCLAQQGVLTTQRDEVGKLLNDWWRQGLAAGHAGDSYDNRDRGHSDFDTHAWPTLQRVSYSEEQRKRNADWAAAAVVQPGVVFGNSSTSAQAPAGGSNARRLYSSTAGLDILYQQYRRNNLYVYPEHQDYDPGRFGQGGWGDLFPTNTPFVLISSGSSGSDQPFLRAIAATLAAFRPDVKQKLIESGMLMPTLQMVLRASLKPVAKAEDYLTPAAHRVVYAGGDLDVLRMVRLAHAITLDTLPPMVQLVVVESSSSQPGRDSFDPYPEMLSQTSSVVATVFRAAQASRRLVVSAHHSIDLNNRPLRFHWVLLQGPEDVALRPINADRSVCEIVIPYHERRPVASKSPMHSNRVDVGVFAHNGAHYSAPAFVTSFSLANELRTYDEQNRLVEIGYGRGEPTLAVRDWEVLLESLLAPTPVAAAELVRSTWSAEQLAALRGLQQRLKLAQEHLRQTERELAEALQAAKAGGSPEDRAARDLARRQAEANHNDALKARQAALQTPKDQPAMAELITQRLTSLTESPTFWIEHHAKLSSTEKPVDPAAAWGSVVRDERGQWRLAPSGAGLTRCQRMLLTRLNQELLAAALPGIKSQFALELVDPALTLPKFWRDVYRYAPDGTLLGWSRYSAAATQEFNAHGLLVQRRDALGRCVEARTVNYSADPKAGLTAKPGPNVMVYEYAHDTDWSGRASRLSPVPEGSR